MTQIDFEEFIRRGQRAQSAAEQARDEGIARVASNNATWIERALAVVSALPSGWTGTGEDMRKHVLAQGIEKPGHSNAWGGMTRMALRTGKFTPTGEWKKPKDTASHARPIREYRRI